MHEQTHVDRKPAVTIAYLALCKPAISALQSGSEGQGYQADN
jgi:hypothetical protein